MKYILHNRLRAILATCVLTVLLVFSLYSAVGCGAVSCAVQMACAAPGVVNAVKNAGKDLGGAFSGCPTAAECEAKKTKYEKFMNDLKADPEFKACFDACCADESCGKGKPACAAVATSEATGKPLTLASVFGSAYSAPSKTLSWETAGASDSSCTESSSSSSSSSEDPACADPEAEGDSCDSGSSSGGSASSAPAANAQLLGQALAAAGSSSSAKSGSSSSCCPTHGSAKCLLNNLKKICEQMRKDQEKCDKAGVHIPVPSECGVFS